MGEHFVPLAAACCYAAIARARALLRGTFCSPQPRQFSMGEHFVPLAAASYYAAIALSLALYFGEHFVPHGPGSFLWRNILFPKDAVYCAFVHLYVGNR